MDNLFEISNELKEIISSYEKIMGDDSFILNLVFSHQDGIRRANNLIVRIKERALATGDLDISQTVIRNLFYREFLDACRTPAGFTMSKSERDMIKDRISKSFLNLKPIIELLDDNWTHPVATHSGEVFYFNKVAVKVFFERFEDELESVIIGNVGSVRALNYNEIKYFCRKIHTYFFDVFGENLWSDVSFFASAIYKTDVTIQDVRDYCRIAR